MSPEIAKACLNFLDCCVFGDPSNQDPRRIPT